MLALQLVHATLSAVALYVPLGQAPQPPACSKKPALHRHEVAADAVAGCAFTGQGTHAPAAIAPVDDKCVPAAQLVQPALPAAVLYLPASHAVHVPPFAPVYPMLHRQLVTAVLPAAEPELPGQLKQLVLSTAETVAEYWPARQLMQVLAPIAPTVLEYLPAPQFVQVLTSVAPTVAEYLPPTHLRHVPAAEAPSAVEYWPASQLMQVLAPVAPTVLEYLPAPQFVQVLTSVAPTVAEYLPPTHLRHVPAAEAPWAVEYLPASQFVHVP